MYVYKKGNKIVKEFPKSEFFSQKELPYNIDPSLYSLIAPRHNKTHAPANLYFGNRPIPLFNYNTLEEYSLTPGAELSIPHYRQSERRINWLAPPTKEGLPTTYVVTGVNHNQFRKNSNTAAAKFYGEGKLNKLKKTVHRATPRYVMAPFTTINERPRGRANINNRPPNNSQPPPPPFYYNLPREPLHPINIPYENILAAINREKKQTKEKERREMQNLQNYEKEKSQQYVNYQRAALYEDWEKAQKKAVEKMFEGSHAAFERQLRNRQNAAVKRFKELKNKNLNATLAAVTKSMEEIEEYYKELKKTFRSLKPWLIYMIPNKVYFRDVDKYMEEVRSTYQEIQQEYRLLKQTRNEPPGTLHTARVGKIDNFMNRPKTFSILVNKLNKSNTTKGVKELINKWQSAKNKKYNNKAEAEEAKKRIANEAKRKTNAVLKIQTAFKEFLNRKKKADAAALKIQTVFRGAMAREQLKKLKNANAKAKANAAKKAKVGPYNYLTKMINNSVKRMAPQPYTAANMAKIKAAKAKANANAKAKANANAKAKAKAKANANAKAKAEEKAKAVLRGAIARRKFKQAKAKANEEARPKPPLPGTLAALLASRKVYNQPSKPSAPRRNQGSSAFRLPPPSLVEVTARTRV